jgi:hypothetical protein
MVPAVGWLERFGPRLVTGRADQLEKIMSASNNLPTFADEVPRYTEVLAPGAVLE